MRAAFADTFYWVALSDPADPHYRQALALESDLANALIVTTEEVLSEYLTFFAGEPWLRVRAGRAVQSLFGNRKIQVIPQSHISFLSGMELYNQRPDKGYSLIDCISMQTMRQEGIDDVLTNDRHFGQEGFRVLFRA